MADWFGMFLSLLCLFHCLIGPFLVLSLPFVFTAYFYSPWFHFVLAMMVVPIGIYSFWLGYRKHGNKTILSLGLVGLCLIAGLGFIPPGGVQNFTKETFIIFASVLLTGAHLFNYRLIKNSSR